MDKYSIHYHCSSKVVIIVTNCLNYITLDMPVILEIDPDHVLHTDTVTVTHDCGTKGQAVQTALRMMDQIELTILEAMQETPIGGIETADLNWLSTDEDILFNAKQELGL